FFGGWVWGAAARGAPGGGGGGRPPDSPAAEAGFQPGDQWLAVNGKPVEGWQDAVSELVLYLGEDEPVSVRVRQSGGATAERRLPLAAWS
ncbi:MAG TPA: hypothetical protein DIW42_00245, partial [Alcanivorax sp.]|nr:hypothetical protein [Alcanivorax sp.]